MQVFYGVLELAITKLFWFARAKNNFEIARNFRKKRKNPGGVNALKCCEKFPTVGHISSERKTATHCKFARVTYKALNTTSFIAYGTKIETLYKEVSPFKLLRLM